MIRVLFLFFVISTMEAYAKVGAWFTSQQPKEVDCVAEVIQDHLSFHTRLLSDFGWKKATKLKRVEIKQGVSLYSFELRNAKHPDEALSGLIRLTVKGKEPLLFCDSRRNSFDSDTVVFWISGWGNNKETKISGKIPTKNSISDMVRKQAKKVERLEQQLRVERERLHRLKTKMAGFGLFPSPPKRPSK